MDTIFKILVAVEAARRAPGFLGAIRMYAAGMRSLGFVVPVTTRTSGQQLPDVEPDEACGS